MSSDRHPRVGRRAGVRRWCVRLGAAVLVALGAGGCFGDWVSARPRPQRDEAEPSTSPKLDAGAPVDSCEAYVAAVAERCEAVLEGHLGHCHRELLRVMTIWHEGNAPLDHRPPRPGATSAAAAVDDPPMASRAEVCAQHMRGLPEPPRRTAASKLGPECRAWGQALRERCVAPLSAIPPDLRRCGPDLLAFESFVGAITFGRPEDHEPSCRDAVERLSPAGAEAPSHEDRESAATKGLAR